MTYDDAGEARCLGYRVESWYGTDWVEGLMRREHLSCGEAVEILERGGTETAGGFRFPLKYDEALLRCFGPATEVAQ